MDEGQDLGEVYPLPKAVNTDVVVFLFFKNGFISSFVSISNRTLLSEFVQRAKLSDATPYKVQELF